MWQNRTSQCDLHPTYLVKNVSMTVYICDIFRRVTAYGTQLYSLYYLYSAWGILFFVHFFCWTDIVELFVFSLRSFLQIHYCYTIVYLQNPTEYLRQKILRPPPRPPLPHIYFQTTDRQHLSQNPPQIWCMPWSTRDASLPGFLIIRYLKESIWKLVYDVCHNLFWRSQVQTPSVFHSWDFSVMC